MKFLNKIDHDLQDSLNLQACLTCVTVKPEVCSQQWSYQERHVLYLCVSRLRFISLLNLRSAPASLSFFSLSWRVVSCGFKLLSVNVRRATRHHGPLTPTLASYLYHCTSCHVVLCHALSCPSFPMSIPSDFLSCPISAASASCRSGCARCG